MEPGFAGSDAADEWSGLRDSYQQRGEVEPVFFQEFLCRVTPDLSGMEADGFRPKLLTQSRL